MEEEHEVYGGDIPEEVEGELEGDLDGQPDNGSIKTDEVVADDAASKELEEMKKRLKEMEEEAAALRDMQAKVEKEMSAVQDPAGAAAALANKEEADARSVFVGNVDYSCTPEEVQQHFQSCGTVNRVTILTDKFGQPKGYAYVEFLEVEAVQNAVLLSESELHARQLKVLTSMCIRNFSAFLVSQRVTFLGSVAFFELLTLHLYHSLSCIYN
jgi:polyadenylate-binding protein 2